MGLRADIFEEVNVKNVAEMIAYYAAQRVI
jgi:hypothetical protein